MPDTDAQGAAATSPEGRLLTEGVGATLVLKISNPERRNALSPGMYAAGVELLNVAADNPDVKSVVLCGDGADFCAGGNLHRLLANHSKPREVAEASVGQLHAWVEAISTFPKPIVAAVEGACAGAGFSLALACDLIVATEQAKFVMAYSSVGLSPDGGATHVLARALPRQAALEIFWLGEPQTALRLHALGVVNRVVPAGSALAVALGLCEKLNARASNALGRIKELLADAPAHSLPEQLQAEQAAFVDHLRHANGAEGIRAFLEKRPANFS
jgi:enoyl-CoA hydratase/carnithine racemase